MSIKAFALVFGIVFLVAGIAGFIPGISPMHHHPDLVITSQSRLALGLFPVNILHNLVHILFGLWGLAAARAAGGARVYAKAVAIIYGLLTVMGLIPGLNTTFGLVPLYGHDIWLHALLALVAAYFGFAHREASEPHMKR
ncbi:DUF4383 domain-containing protein [Sphingomonas sp. SRS2]|uniref:DUF4383 domain-containing protein n=1 Tax=Sphingomonas sp. SRS2 TaxID=133190 RepID=UPI0006183FEF|nr:DUF4383 domain-containing protein [Sphingomonas sp. SRS2]KKC24647.1 membrane protein [Sphingomonas sp. SRS2]